MNLNSARLSLRRGAEPGLLGSCHQGWFSQTHGKGRGYLSWVRQLSHEGWDWPSCGSVQRGEGPASPGPVKGRAGSTMALWLHHAWFLWLPVVTLVTDVDIDPSYKRPTDPDRSLSQFQTTSATQISSGPWARHGPRWQPRPQAFAWAVSFLSFFFKSFALLHTNYNYNSPSHPFSRSPPHLPASLQPIPRPLFWKSKPSHS